MPAAGQDGKAQGWNDPARVRSALESGGKCMGTGYAIPALRYIYTSVPPEGGVSQAVVFAYIESKRELQEGWKLRPHQTRYIRFAQGSNLGFSSQSHGKGHGIVRQAVPAGSSCMERRYALRIEHRKSVRELRAT
ncbi:hypothetical protein KXR53_33290 [Inquilinus limosus]|uniref:hypothetical protein n=1 Tax=Inquilinus limosus TaxID=171674 RepID=UPI003F1864FE